MSFFKRAEPKANKSSASARSASRSSARSASRSSANARAAQRKDVKRIHRQRLQAQINERKLMREARFTRELEKIKQAHPELEKAVMSSDVEALRAFIRSHPVGELNTYIPKPDSDGYEFIPVLFVATGALKEYYTSLPAGNVQILKILLDAGANPNILDDDSNPVPAIHDPLDMQMLQMLVDAGADVNLDDNGGHTPLMEQRGPEEVSFLVQKWRRHQRAR